MPDWWRFHSPLPASQAREKRKGFKGEPWRVPPWTFKNLPFTLRGRGRGKGYSNHIKFFLCNSKLMTLGLLSPSQKRASLPLGAADMYISSVSCCAFFQNTYYIGYGVKKSLNTFFYNLPSISPPINQQFITFYSDYYTYSIVIFTYCQVIICENFCKIILRWYLWTMLRKSD